METLSLSHTQQNSLWRCFPSPVKTLSSQFPDHKRTSPRAAVSSRSYELGKNPPNRWRKLGKTEHNHMEHPESHSRSRSEQSVCYLYCSVITLPASVGRCNCASVQCYEGSGHADYHHPHDQLRSDPIAVAFNEVAPPLVHSTVQSHLVKCKFEKCNFSIPAATHLQVFSLFDNNKFCSH